jgi:hypothetical protein
MGFLDKLLGRGKDAAEKAGDVAGDVGATAKDTYEDARAKVSGDDEPAATAPAGAEDASDIGQAEERLDEVRDQAARDQGRMP